MARGLLAVNSNHFLSSLCGSPLSGEIDIVESRGNNATYAGQYVGPPLFLPFC